MADLLGVRTEMLDDGCDDGDAVASLVLRDAGGQRLHLRRRGATGRRFEAARLLADSVAGHAQGWLIAADTPTGRQKLQRAFAAELLAPRATVGELVPGSGGEREVELAARHFDVSPMMIQRQLQNLGRGEAVW